MSRAGSHSCMLVFNMFKGGSGRLPELPEPAARKEYLKSQLELLARFVIVSGAQSVALQEVDRATKRVFGLDVPAVLREALLRLSEKPWSAHFAPAIAMPGGGSYGVATLTAWPVHKCVPVFLGKSVAGEARTSLAIKYLLAEKIRLWVVNVHLGLKRANQLFQLDRLCLFLNKLDVKAHVLLVGDMNIDRRGRSSGLSYDELLSRLNHELERPAFVDLGPEDAVTFPTRSIGKKIDYVFHSAARGDLLALEGLRVEVMKRAGDIDVATLSDHHALRITWHH